MLCVGILTRDLWDSHEQVPGLHLRVRKPGQKRWVCIMSVGFPYSQEIR